MTFMIKGVGSLIRCSAFQGWFGAVSHALRISNGPPPHLSEFKTLLSLAQAFTFHQTLKRTLSSVIRSSPQFAFTLVTYELLHKHFPYAGSAQSTAQTLRPSRGTTDISRIRARNALRILLDCSSRFGMIDPNAAARGVGGLPKILRG